MEVFKKAEFISRDRIMARAVRFGGAVCTTSCALFGSAFFFFFIYWKHSDVRRSFPVGVGK
jgi:hypothetical protein